MITGPVLDAGCGPGFLTSGLTIRGGPLVGMDLSLDAVKAFVTETSDASHRVGIVADLRQPCFRDGTFALVVCGFVFHHLLRSDAFESLGRLTSDGGRLQILDLYRRSNSLWVYLLWDRVCVNLLPSALLTGTKAMGIMNWLQYTAASAWLIVSSRSFRRHAATDLRSGLPPTLREWEVVALTLGCAVRVPLVGIVELTPLPYPRRIA